MRKGVNPEKAKGEKNHHYSHRVIIPIYVPDQKEEFYLQSIKVFKCCIESLLDSINPQTTAITVIDNNSSREVKELLKNYRDKIEKIITYSDNKGKIYPVLSEAKGCYEPFVTIADADIFFFKGWEKEVFKIFRAHKKAGIVSPVPTPNNAFLSNSSLFFDHFWKSGLKYGKVVKEEDAELYKKGLGYEKILDRGNRVYSWKEKQYYLDGRHKAVVGSGHFVSTYRKFLFDNSQSFPEFKFRNGDEHFFLDDLADKKGFYRLSTPEVFAYHMGNKIEIMEDKKGDQVRKDEIDLLNNKRSRLFIPYIFKNYFFGILRKVKKM